jgi:hypothetical protein
MSTYVLVLVHPEPVAFRQVKDLHPPEQ